MFYLIVYLVIGFVIVFYIEQTFMKNDRSYTIWENYEWLFVIIAVLGWPYVLIKYITDKDNFGSM
jgi:hypothetical protein